MCVESECKLGLFLVNILLHLYVCCIGQTAKTIPLRTNTLLGNHIYLSLMQLMLFLNQIFVVAVLSNVVTCQQGVYNEKAAINIIIIELYLL